MSLPREWSYLQDSCRSVDRGPKTTTSSQEMCLGNRGLAYDPDTPATSTLIDENMNQSNQLGSLFSIHSAPVFDINGGCASGAGILSSPTRPGSLIVQTTATSTPIVPPHLQSPPDTIEDEDNDNLLTISSLTARPLIAKSRELRSSRNNGKKSKPRRNNNKNNNNNNISVRDKRRKNVNYVPLDGGYGWIVVCGAFFVQFWVAGLVKSYGVLYVEVMETFRDSSASVASWIPAILSFFCLALAPVTSMLCQKYSCRVVVFIGGLFCALGLTISFFATSLIHLFFTFGVLTGIGGGLSTTPGIIIVSQYFDKHRALANGICVSGTAAGSFVFPLLIEALVANFGFHGTILLLGGCMLHVCVSAALYRPLEDNPAAALLEPTEKVIAGSTRSLEFGACDEQQQQQQQNFAKQQRLELLFANDATTRHNLLNELFHRNNVVAMELTDSEEEKDIMGEGLRMKPISKIRSSSILHSVEDLSTDSTCVYKARASLRSLRSSAATVVCPAVPREPIMADQESMNVTRQSMSQKIARYIDLTLLKNPQFIMMCLSVSLMSTGSPYMLYYLPAYVHAAGYTKSEAGYLVAISAALDLCGRLGLGWLSDLQLFDRRKGYIGSIVGAGVAVLAIPMAHSFYVLACSVGMYGLCLGCWFLLVPVLLADQYGTDKISSSYGLVRMFQSVGAISIPPLAGYLRDVTGSYSVCFLCMGTCMVLGGLPLLLVSSEIVQKSTSTLQHVRIFFLIDIKKQKQSSIRCRAVLTCQSKTGDSVSITVLADSKPETSETPRKIVEPDEKDKTRKKKKKKKEQTKGDSSILKKKTEDEQHPIWYHEWTSPKLLSSKGNFGLHEIVHGPFASPRIVRASPCIILDSSRSDRVAASPTCNKTVGIRCGIPDPWKEYLALRGYCTQYDKRIAKRHLRLGCDSVRLTEAVWNDLGLSLTQGIPDPWKSYPYESKSFIESRPTRFKRGKSRIKLLGTSKDQYDNAGHLTNIETSSNADNRDRMNLPKNEKYAQENLSKVKPSDSKIPQSVAFAASVDAATNSKEHPERRDPMKNPSNGQRGIREQQKRESVVHARHTQESNHISCEIDKIPFHASFPKDESSTRKNVRRTTILEENVEDRRNNFRQEQIDTGTHCRVCQPEVTPTRYSNRTRLGHENFWRCTRHQPGSSYRLETSKSSKQIEDSRSNGEYIEPENNQDRWVRRDASNKKSVACVIKGLLRSCKEKKRIKERREEEEKNPAVNFICCRCSCPYLKTVRRSNGNDGEFENYAIGHFCERCHYENCGKNIRERRIKRKNSHNCPKHCRLENNKFKVSSLRIDCHPRAFQELICEKSATRMTDGQSKLSAELPEYAIPEFARYVSPESGAHADISDASVRTNFPVDAASVTSSTFIHFMKKRPKGTGIIQNQIKAHHSRDTLKMHAASSRLKNRRGKQRCIVDTRSKEENLSSCLDARGVSQFKVVDEFTPAEKHVTYEVKSSSQRANDANRSKSPEARVPAKSSKPEVVKGYNKIDRNDHEEMSFCSTSTGDELSREDEPLRTKNSANNHWVTSPRKNKALKTQKEFSERRNDDCPRQTASHAVDVISSDKLSSGKQSRERRKKMRTDRAECQADRGPPVSKSNFRKREQIKWEQVESQGSYAAEVNLHSSCCVRDKSFLRKSQATEAEEDSVDSLESQDCNPKEYGRNEDNDVTNEMVESFQKDVSEESDKNDTDDPEIEIIDPSEKITSFSKETNTCRQTTICTERERTKSVFFEIAKNDAPSLCHVKNCTKRIWNEDQKDEELCVQSYSDSDDDLHQ